MLAEAFFVRIQFTGDAPESGKAPLWTHLLLFAVDQQFEGCEIHMQRPESPSGCTSVEPCTPGRGL